MHHGVVRLACRCAGSARGGLRGLVAHARLHIRNALCRQRVAAQIWKRAAIIQARSLLQFVKHRHCALRVKASLGHHTKAHAIRLALHIP